MPLQLPLAAGLDWLEGIVPLLIFLFWVASQVRSIFGGAGRGKAAGPVVVRPAPRPPLADDERHREIARQIEEFLRDSGSRNREAPPAPPRPTEGPAERRRRTEAASRDQPPRPPQVPRPPQPAPPRRAASRVPAGAPRPPQPPPAIGSLGGHAADVARHVEDAFAHDPNNFPSGLSRTGGGAARAGTAAIDIAALLRDPATLRNLVIVREVLDRPVERW
jgi:hypothetical protein